MCLACRLVHWTAQSSSCCWHSCRQFRCSGLCNISLLFDDFVVNGLGRCNGVPIHAHGRFARRQNDIAFGCIENMGWIDGRLLRLSFCANILVAWVGSDTRRSRLWKLYNRFASKINHKILSFSLARSVCVCALQITIIARDFIRIGARCAYSLDSIVFYMFIYVLRVHRWAPI